MKHSKVVKILPPQNLKLSSPQNTMARDESENDDDDHSSEDSKVVERSPIQGQLD